MKTPALLSLISTLFILSSKTHAILGEYESSVEKDRQTLQASSHKLTQKSGYTVHEMKANGNTIKEYISSDGIVFAISWRGIKHPDLSVLLGSHYSEYVEASQAQAPPLKTRQPVLVKTSKIVVHKGGHMRDMRGKAFVPDLVPSGVNVEDLQ